MRLTNDDSLYRVDSRYLGPRGWSLPFAARYSAYGVGFLVFLVVLVAERKTGIPFSPFSAVLAMAVTVGLTTLLHRRVDAERPVRTVAASFWRELSAPRPPCPASVQVRMPRRRR